MAHLRSFYAFVFKEERRRRRGYHTVFAHTRKAFSCHWVRLLIEAWLILSWTEIDRWSMRSRLLVKRFLGLAVGGKGDKLFKQDTNWHGLLVLAPSCSTSALPCGGSRWSVNGGSLYVVCVFYRAEGSGGKGNSHKSDHYDTDACYSLCILYLRFSCAASHQSGTAC